MLARMIMTMHRPSLLICSLLGVLTGGDSGVTVAGAHAAASACPPTPQGDVWLEGGEFVMGARPEWPEEGPPRQVKVASFAIDRTEVTNASFAEFVQATGYRTLAERAPDPRFYSGVPPDELRPSSLVFVATARDPSGIGWRVVPGADWRHPEGPGSSIDGREHHPVVHVAYEDALAYARWKGRDLPTEAEWEFAARAGLNGARFVWGDEPSDPRVRRANHWQGAFPWADTGADGYKAHTAPVGCFPSNGYGLYDMAGNVWEWTNDWYRPNGSRDPAGPAPEQAFDPSDSVPKHVIKGGSFLCADDYCFRYRPSARQPGPPDTGASHVGFRTVLRARN